MYSIELQIAYKTVYTYVYLLVTTVNKIRLDEEIMYLKFGQNYQYKYMNRQISYELFVPYRATHM